MICQRRYRKAAPRSAEAEPGTRATFGFGNWKQKPRSLGSDPDTSLGGSSCRRGGGGSAGREPSARAPGSAPCRASQLTAQRGTPPFVPRRCDIAASSNFRWLLCRLIKQTALELSLPPPGWAPRLPVTSVKSFSVSAAQASAFSGATSPPQGAGL